MRTPLIIFITIVALIVGALGVVDFLNTKDKPTVTTEVVSPEEDQYVAVWVTTNFYDRGDEVTSQGVAKKQFPLNEALKLGIREDAEISFSPSVLLNRSLKTGEVVLPEYQVAPNQPGYVDLLVSPGMTLYPLQVSNRNLIKDYIRPGSYIDILTVSSPNENLAGNLDKPKRFKGVEATMFLKNVKVLNIGGGDDDSENNYVTAQSPVEEDGVTTVVIEVDPNELTRLALAQRTMHIEVYRSQAYTQSEHAEVRNIIDNYTGIEELRGNERERREAL